MDENKIIPNTPAAIAAEKAGEALRLFSREIDQMVRGMEINMNDSSSKDKNIVDLNKHENLGDEILENIGKKIDSYIRNIDLQKVPNDLEKQRLIKNAKIEGMKNIEGVDQNRKFRIVCFYELHIYLN